MDTASWLQLYMRVVVMRGGRKPGTIRFIGETEFGPGTWVGVELDAPQGNNSGTIDVRVAVCAPHFSRGFSLWGDISATGRHVLQLCSQSWHFREACQFVARTRSNRCRCGYACQSRAWCGRDCVVSCWQMLLIANRYPVLDQQSHPLRPRTYSRLKKLGTWFQSPLNLWLKPPRLHHAMLYRRL
jgi:CAP-Gly domain